MFDCRLAEQRDWVPKSAFLSAPPDMTINSAINVAAEAHAALPQSPVKVIVGRDKRGDQSIRRLRIPPSATRIEVTERIVEQVQVVVGGFEASAGGEQPLGNRAIATSEPVRGGPSGFRTSTHWR